MSMGVPKRLQRWQLPPPPLPPFQNLQLQGIFKGLGVFYLLWVFCSTPPGKLMCLPPYPGKNPADAHGLVQGGSSPKRNHLCWLDRVMGLEAVAKVAPPFDKIGDGGGGTDAS